MFVFFLSFCCTAACDRIYAALCVLYLFTLLSNKYCTPLFANFARNQTARRGMALTLSDINNNNNNNKWPPTYRPCIHRRPILCPKADTHFTVLHAED